MNRRTLEIASVAFVEKRPKLDEQKRRGNTKASEERSFTLVALISRRASPRVKPSRERSNLVVNFCFPGRKRDEKRSSLSLSLTPLMEQVDTLFTRPEDHGARSCSFLRSARPKFDARAEISLAEPFRESNADQGRSSASPFLAGNDLRGSLPFFLGRAVDSFVLSLRFVTRDRRGKSNRRRSRLERDGRALFRHWEIIKRLLSRNRMSLPESPIVAVIRI